MDLSLNTHLDQYTFDWPEKFHFTWTLPYAERHRDLSTDVTGFHYFLHRSIACLESIPIFGVLIGTIEKIIVISEPQVYIRYGNALWSARGFEIWMFKWPLLIWGFNEFSNSSKLKVTPLEPWRSLKKILHSRAIGSYSIIEFNKFILNKPMSYSYLQARFIAQIPGSLANIICGSYCILINRKARSGAYDLARSQYSTWVSKLAARILKV